MSGASQNYLRELIAEYVKAGYPSTVEWGFTPDNDSERQIYRELESLGVIRPLARAYFFVDSALRTLLKKVPMSDQARELL